MQILAATYIRSPPFYYTNSIQKYSHLRQEEAEYEKLLQLLSLQKE